MRARSPVLLAISLILGGGAIAWVKGVNSAPAPAPQAEGTSIVVASAALNFGDHVSADALQLVKWPDGTAPKGTFSKIEDVSGPGQDRVVLRAMEPGEPVLASKVSGSGGRASLSTVIDKDMRAVTIHVNDATGVAGFVLPGDRVDVMLTRDQNENRENPKTDVLLQSVKVLGIDQEASERKDKPTVVKAVTVEVLPVDAQKLTLGTALGTLSLSLRNFASGTEVPTTTLSMRGLLEPTPAKPAAGAPPARPAAAPRIEILRGTEATSYDVRRDHTTIAAPTGQAAKAGGQPTAAYTQP